MPGAGGLRVGHTDPLRGRCVPYSDRAVRSTFQVVLGVGPAVDDAPHHLPLACATGRVSFSEGGSASLLRLGQIPDVPVRRDPPDRNGRLAWDFRLPGLTRVGRSRYGMSDNGSLLRCHRLGGISRMPAGPLSLPADHALADMELQEVFP